MIPADGVQLHRRAWPVCVQKPAGHRTLAGEAGHSQQESKEASLDLMKRHSPAIIPRNHRVEEALDAAVEKDDYSLLDKLTGALSNPFAYTPDQDEFVNPPEDASQPHVTYCGI